MGGGVGGDLKENNFTKIFKGREDIFHRSQEQNVI